MAFFHHIQWLEPRVLFSAGDLDPSFGAAGAAVIAFTGQPAGTTVAVGAVASADGATLITGEIAPPYSASAPPPNDQVYLAKLDANGQLDPTFGAGGIIITSAMSQVQSVLILPTGKILIAGSTGSFNQGEAAVACFNTDGTVDTAFGTAGIVDLPYPGENDYGASAANLYDDSGNIYVTATDSYQFDTDIDCLLPSGAFNSAFGAGGVAETGLSSTGATGLAITASGIIVIAGYPTYIAEAEAPTNVVMEAFYSTGAPDEQFSYNRIGTHNLNRAGLSAASLVTDSTGDVVATSNDSIGNTFAPIVLGPTGKVTQRFQSIHLGASDGSAVNGISLAPGGQIIVTGTYDDVSEPEDTTNSIFTFLARYDADGKLDKTFGTDGVESVPAGTFAVQSDGEIVTAGPSPDNTEVLVNRYLSTGALASPPAGVVSLSVSTALPVELDAGARPAGGAVSATITNNSSQAIAGNYTLQVLLASDPLDAGGTSLAAVDSSDTTWTQRTVRVNVAPGASQAISVRLPTVPLVDSNDYLMAVQMAPAKRTGGAGVTLLAASANPQRIAAAATDADLYIDAGNQGSSQLEPGVSDYGGIELINVGNTAVHGRAQISYGLVPENDASAAPIPVGVLKLALSMPVNADKLYKLRFVGPADLADGTYDLLANFTTTAAGIGAQDAIDCGTFTVGPSPQSPSSISA